MHVAFGSGHILMPPYSCTQSQSKLKCNSKSKRQQAARLVPRRQHKAMTKHVWHHTNLCCNNTGRARQIHAGFQTAYVSSRYLMISELSNIATLWLGSCSRTQSAVKHVQQWGMLRTKDSNNKECAVPHRGHRVTPRAESKHQCKFACRSEQIAMLCS